MRWALILIVWVAFSFAFTACQSPGASPDAAVVGNGGGDGGWEVEKWVDPATGATCYIIGAGYGTALSCLP